MHRHALVYLLILAVLGIALPAQGETADALARARGLLARQDGVAAATILEAALGEAGAVKPLVLSLLRQSYELAAKQSEASGKSHEAELYRENLRILNRTTRAQSSPEKVAPKPVVEEPEAPRSAPPLPEVVTAPPESVELPPLAPPVDVPQPASSASRPVVETPVEEQPVAARPADLLPLPAEKPIPASDLNAADAAFLAERYAEAGQIYATLAREKKLPKERNDCWAYCRSVMVAKRINARPNERTEWASIDSEIQQIRKLDPNNWIGEYLRNLAAERPGAKKPASPGSTVVRGSAPEEAPVAGSTVRAQSSSAPLNGGQPKPAQSIGRWQLKETVNFRIFHVDPALAAKVAQIAEGTRLRQTKFWTGAEPQSGWLPKCEIYLYPNARLYGQMTGQPEDSPGFSTMGMNEGKIIGRRVNVRVDHPTVLTAVLPHEITHVILADYFTEQQIPRWADEGMSVLSEPVDEQRRRAADLAEPLAADRLFPIANLMTMDYPESQYWNLYYAQSVSLTKYLVEIGSPALLVKYLQASQTGNPEAELRRLYRIDGHADLQRRWVEYARKQAIPTLASPNSAKPDQRVR